MTTAKDLADMANDTLEEQSVEELMYAAEEAVVDSDATEGDLVHKPSGDVPFGMRVDEVLSAGHVWVYDIRNGDRSRINKNNLQVQLGKRDPDTGKRVFTTDKNYPGMPTPTVGQYKCILHKDDPNRAEYDKLGFVVCKKSKSIKRLLPNQLPRSTCVSKEVNFALLGVVSNDRKARTVGAVILNYKHPRTGID